MNSTASTRIKNKDTKKIMQVEKEVGRNKGFTSNFFT